VFQPSIASASLLDRLFLRGQVFNMISDVRRLVRPLFPKRLHRACSKWADDWSILMAEGPNILRQLRRRDNELIALQLKSLQYPFTIRLQREHIRELANNVFQKQYDACLGGFSPKTIIDAGCFIGELAAHWATKWPEARIVSLEPNSENYRMAEANLSAYGDRVKLVKKGLWTSDENLKVIGTLNASSVTSAGEGPFDVRGVSVPSLMKEFNFDSVDLLKLDIEGAEFAVLGESADAWLPKVRCIIIEFHDPNKELGVWRKLESLGFRGNRYRSVVTFLRGAALS
jgi:FkbM family methyltransferase